MGEFRILVEILEKGCGFLYAHVGVDISHGEDTTGKVATHGDKADFSVEAGLELTQCLLDFGKMLMLESFVDREIIGAPAEVGCRTGLHACSGRAGDACDMNLAVQFSCGGKRKKRYLEGCGETSRIGYFPSTLDALKVRLGETVDISVALIAVILCEVHNLESLGHLVFLPELAAESMTLTKEQNIDGIQIVILRKCQIGFANKPLVYVGDGFAGVAGRVHELDFSFRVVEEQS